MSIQRWTHDDDMGHPRSFQQDDEGKWVTYADHVEALRQAEQRGASAYEAEIAAWGQKHYEQGQRDGYEQAKRIYMAAGEAGLALAASDALAGAVQRVEAAHSWVRGTDPDDVALWRSDVIAAIKGDLA